jgi:hypothetical protein
MVVPAQTPCHHHRAALALTPLAWQTIGSATFFVVALLLLGCSTGAAPDTVSCHKAPLLGGTTRAEFLALAEAQERAVCAVEITDRTTQEVGLCSATLIAPDLVLTTAHCFPTTTTEAVVIFGADVQAPVAALEVWTIAVHPQLDLALLRLESDARQLLDVHPIPVGGEVDLAPESPVQIAGFGFSAENIVGIKQFATSRVQEFRDSEFVVFAHHRAGACAGDSGGPALVRNATGHVVLAGVLSHGSLSCAGSDSYVSVAEARDWLESQGAPFAHDSAVLADCSLVGAQGRCFAGAALWCDGDTPVAESCESGLRCGFSDAADGFRCIEPTADVCHGITDRGRCNGDERLVCVGGTVVSSPCGACNATCALSVRDGAAICNAR